MLRFEDLNYLVAVQENGTLTKAAEKLYVTQPAISTALKKLEADLGVPLLKRKGTGVELTDAGKHIASMSQNVLESIAEIESYAFDVANLRHIELTVYSSTATMLFASALLSVFYNLFPKDLMDVQKLSDDPFRDLSTDPSRGIALSIEFLEDPSHDSKLFCEEVLGSGNLGIAVGKNSTLFPKSKHAISFAELEDLPIITVVTQESQPVYKELRSRLNALGIHPAVKTTLPDMHAAQVLVARNVGVTPMLDIALPNTSISDDCRFLPFEESLEFGLVARYRNDIDPNVLKAFMMTIDNMGSR